jgi:flavin-dependent dehydrogenase
MTVGVIGGGPAGAHAAQCLAGTGVRTVLFDEKLAWEKPCGGGLTWKAYSRYPFLAESGTPRRTVAETVIGAPGAQPVTFQLDRPVLIYSRRELNGMLLARAEAAGARIQNARVLAMEREGTGWSLRTRTETVAVDFCILAAGARNPLRDFGTALQPGDTMIALGYYVPGDRDRIDLEFLEGLDGYIWVFPRCGHLSVGICGKGESAASLKSRLHGYMDQRGLSRADATFYSHLLPALDTSAWKRNRVAGEGWIAVGDAAGLVDPITGEGLYYAVRSADLASDALLKSGAQAAPTAYRAALRDDIETELEFAARISTRFFRGRMLGGPVPRRMVELTRLSPTFRRTMCELFAGNQPYLGLKQRLRGDMLRILVEIAAAKVAAVLPYRRSALRER